MTPAQLKDYLIGHATGIADASRSKVADVAAEAGYAAVWGAYRWSIRRATATLSTVASQAYTALPAGFESVRSVLYQGATRYHRINFKEESQFDEDYPKPSKVSGVPQFAKLVYNGPSAADQYRVYWFPVPDAVYSLAMAYNKQSDLSFLPNLPPWLVHAVVQKALVLIQPTIEKKYQAHITAKDAISEAIAADSPTNTNDPQFGSDPDWDGFIIGGGTSSVKDGVWP